jgi:hypothetical protein
MKICELIEVDLGRRGFLKGVGAAAASTALPKNIPAEIVKQIVKDVKPSNIGAVSDLLSNFNIQDIWRLFRTWDDPDMWQVPYLLSESEREKLGKIFVSDWKKFLETHPEGEEYQPEGDPDALPNRHFGDARRNFDKYIDWRIASDNADKLDMTQEEIESAYSGKHSDVQWEISKQWPKLIPYIDRLLGKQTEASQALDILRKNGITNVQKFSEEESLWNVLREVYGQSFGNAWPEDWPSFDEMLKKGDFSISPKGEAKPITDNVVSAPHNTKEVGQLFKNALRAAASLLRKGSSNIDALKNSPNIKLSLNKPDDQQNPKTHEPPAKLSAPEPKIDLGLGNLDQEKDKDKIQRR